MTNTGAPHRARRTYADRIARPVAVIVSLVIVGFVIAAVLLPRGSHPAPGQCRGQTGHAAIGRRYAVTLATDGNRVVSTVDFDGRLWRAVDGQVARNGLAPAAATVLDGAVTLVNPQEATFTSPAAYATFLPLTRADGCPTASVVRSGHALG
jgi:hypothetical protein